jgi:signal transduction histidine kinase
LDPPIKKQEKGIMTNKKACRTNTGVEHDASESGPPPLPKVSPGKGTVVTLHNIAPENHAAERSRRTERLAAMGEMAAKIAHDIRNPLGCIELFANNLQSALDQQPDLRVLADRISSSVKSIDAIITNLLLFIRPGESTRFERFDIYTVLDDALFFMEHLANRENSIVVSLAYTHRPLFIEGDLELMKQVCLNILLNAVQSMPDGGRLCIKTSRQTESGSNTAAWMELRISDSGKGIAPEQMKKIFNPFYSTKARGTGLGLSIVHSIVEKHDGYIDVESAPGRGTEFCIHLPLCSRQEDHGYTAAVTEAMEREAFA